VDISCASTVYSEFDVQMLEKVVMRLMKMQLRCVVG